MGHEIRKHSILLHRNKTSISLEDQFWEALREIAAVEGTSPGTRISQIDEKRWTNCNLSSAIRLFVLEHFRARASLPLRVAFGATGVWCSCLASVPNART
jgi:predicted DNA-binding ribbon-helix-helix protein